MSAAALLAATEYVDLLNGVEYKLLTVLGKWFDRAGVSELALSYGQLTKAIGCALSTTISAVRSLVARDLIECDTTPGSAPNVYRAPKLTGALVPSPKIGEGSPKIGEPGELFDSPEPAYPQTPNNERARANLHSLTPQEAIVSEACQKPALVETSERPQPEKPDPAAEEIVAAVEACFETTLDDWLADQFRLFPRQFNVPALACVEWIISKCKEKQVRRTPDEKFTPGALWEFATKPKWRDLSRWYAPRAREYEARRAVLDQSEPPPRKPPQSAEQLQFEPRAMAAGAGG